jgi:hypothetical protein
MTQLSLFDIIEEDTKETPSIPNVTAAEVVNPIEEKSIDKPIEKPIEKPKKPTFIVDYYDADGRFCFGWLRARDEDDARYKFMKENPRCKIRSIALSDRDYDVLEALD